MTEKSENERAREQAARLLALCATPLHEVGTAEGAEYESHPAVARVIATELLAARRKLERAQQENDAMFCTILEYVRAVAAHDEARRTKPSRVAERKDMREAYAALCALVSPP